MRSGLSRKNAYKTSMLRNLATSLILYERITTTTAKACEVKSIVEHLIQVTRKNDLNARRRLLSYLFDKNATKKVMEDLQPRYKDTKTGMVRSYKLNKRLGDGAKMTILELQKGKEIIESENGKESNEKVNAKEKSEVTGKTSDKGKNSVKSKAKI